MQLTFDCSALEKLLHHAAAAACLVGHLDDDAHADVIDQLAEHAHGLTEILGKARTHAAPDGLTHNGALMLASSAGGVA